MNKKEALIMPAKSRNKAQKAGEYVCTQCNQTMQVKAKQKIPQCPICGKAMSASKQK
jgi:rubrerythrin